VGETGGNVELVGVLTVVVLGVGDGGGERLADHDGDVALDETQDVVSVAHVAAADQVEDLARLGGRRPDVPHPGAGADALVDAGGARVGLRPSHRRPFTFFSWPAWYRKVRVGENSPNLWPTIDSVMYTGTCLRPSCTAIVWPTISGMIVERRDQVLMTFFSPAAFRPSTFLSRWSSTNGPFFSLPGMAYLPPPPLRLRRPITLS